MGCGADSRHLGSGSVCPWQLLTQMKAGLAEVLSQATKRAPGQGVWYGCNSRLLMPRVAGDTASMAALLVVPVTVFRLFVCQAVLFGGPSLCV